MKTKAVDVERLAMICRMKQSRRRTHELTTNENFSIASNPQVSFNASKLGVSGLKALRILNATVTSATSSSRIAPD